MQSGRSTSYNSINNNGNGADDSNNSGFCVPADTLEGIVLQRQLRFFFMNPYEKFRLTGEFPWKLCIQIVKIVLVTLQVKSTHVQFVCSVSHGLLTAD